MRIDDELDPVLVRVRADTAEFRREVARLRGDMEGNLGAGADAAGRGIATALAQAARRGRVEFEDLARVAARLLGEVAGAALRPGSIPGTAAPGLGSLLQGAVTSLLGAPGRATGGPVAPGAAYVVGERGPELFVPTSSGRVEPMGGRATASVHVSVQVQVPPGAGQAEMSRTGRQIAREVARALEQARR